MHLWRVWSEGDAEEDRAAGELAGPYLGAGSEFIPLFCELSQRLHGSEMDRARGDSKQVPKEDDGL